MSPSAEAGDGARAGSMVARMMLGGQLRRLREAAGVTPGGAGYHIRASRAKISRLETGRARCKERDVLDLLALYGVDDAEAVRMKRQDLLAAADPPRCGRSWTRRRCAERPAARG
jgi:Helix-turn-helix domain